MPIFELQGDDGAVYEVDAPDEESAVQAFKEETMPNVSQTELFRPDVQARATLQKQRPDLYGQGQRTFLQGIDDRVRSIASGAPLIGGWMDEISAGLNTGGGLCFSRGEGSLADRHARGKESAAWGGVFGTAVPLAAKPIGWAANKMFGQANTLAPTLDEILQKKTAAYDATKQAGIYIRPDRISTLADDIINKSLADDIDTEPQPRASRLLDILESKKGKALSLPELDNLRKQAVRIAQTGPADESYFAGKVIDATRQSEHQLMAAPESTLQRAVFQLLGMCGRPGVIAFHCPNGLVSNARAVRRMKAQGLTAGVADICLVRPGGAAAFLELKSKSGRQTPEQVAFEHLCKANGSPYVIARTIDEAITALTAWGCIGNHRRKQMTPNEIDTLEQH